MRSIPVLLMVATIFPMTACPKSEESKPAPATAQPAAATPQPQAAPVQTTLVKPPEAMKPAEPAPAAGAKSPVLLDPSKATEKAPDAYKVQFATSKGNFTIEVHREWAPQGADRFYNLVKAGFYDDVRFFRVVSGFMVQFGISGDPALNTVWRNARITDDPVTQSNKRGFITFATSGPNSRTSQVFINFVDNVNLDHMGFAPFGQVTDGMSVVDSLYNGYGEGFPRGAGPDQGRIQSEGNAYLNRDFAKLDYVNKATIQ